MSERAEAAPAAAPRRRDAPIPVERWIAAAPLPEWQVGLGVAAALGAVTALMMSTAPAIDYERAFFERRVPFMLCLAWGYVPAAFAYMVRHARSDLAELAPGLWATRSEIAAFDRALWRYPRGPLLVALAIGLVFPLPFQELTVERWSRFASGAWNREDVWSAVVVCTSWWMVFPVLYGFYRMAAVFRALGAERLPVRLFDPGRGRPLARFGLRVFLLLFALPSLVIAGLLALGWGHPAITAGAMAMNGVLGCLCLLWPASGLRTRVREAKREELERVDRAVAGDRSALRASPMADWLEDVGLVDLLTYRREVEGVREWPFDAPVITRFGLYLVLPLASWVAAALVERGVDAALR